MKWYPTEFNVALDWRQINSMLLEETSVHPMLYWIEPQWTLYVMMHKYSHWIHCYWVEPHWIQHFIEWNPTKFNVIEWNLSESNVILNGIPLNSILFGIESHYKWFNVIYWNPTTFNNMEWYPTKFNVVFDWRQIIRC